MVSAAFVRNSFLSDNHKEQHQKGSRSPTLFSVFLRIYMLQRVERAPSKDVVVFMSMESSGALHKMTKHLRDDKNAKKAIATSYKKVELEYLSILLYFESTIALFSSTWRHLLCPSFNPLP